MIAGTDPTVHERNETATLARARPVPAVGGLVLAGGEGRRLGQPKATVLLGGTTLVEGSIAALRPWCDPIVVTTRPEVPLDLLAVPVIEDPPGPRCALAGIAAGLAQLDTASVVVLACDLRVAPGLLERLLAADGPAAVAVDSGGAQPLCARYPRARALEACRALLEAGDLRARRLLELLAAVTVVAGPGELRNLNTPADVAAAARDLPPS